MGQMIVNLGQLVDRGEVDEALQTARPFTPRAVRDSLFATGGFMEDSTPYGEFVSRWYDGLDSPYLRAEAADWFAQSYLTELADVADAETVGARMATGSKADVLRHLTTSLLSKDLEDWNTSPEEPLTNDALEAWRQLARTIQGLGTPS